MKLADWLTSNALTPSDFATRLGRSASTITRLIPRPGKRHTRHPGRKLMAEIAEATAGQVTPNDFADDANATRSDEGRAA